MRLMAVLILIFFIAIGKATFIESEHGRETAMAIVYSARWFEWLLFVLSISMVGNIFKHRLYRLEKLGSFIFHVSFLIIILGAAITRYYSFEGLM